MANYLDILNQIKAKAQALAQQFQTEFNATEGRRQIKGASPYSDEQKKIVQSGGRYRLIINGEEVGSVPQSDGLAYAQNWAKTYGATNYVDSPWVETGKKLGAALGITDPSRMEFERLASNNELDLLFGRGSFFDETQKDIEKKMERLSQAQGAAQGIAPTDPYYGQEAMYKGVESRIQEINKMAQTAGLGATAENPFTPATTTRSTPYIPPATAEDLAAAGRAPQAGQAQPAGATPTGERQQILNEAALRNYTEAQIERIPGSNAILLKPGVTPIAGTTKPYGGTQPPPTAPATPPDVPKVGEPGAPTGPTWPTDTAPPAPATGTASPVDTPSGSGTVDTASTGVGGQTGAGAGQTGTGIEGVNTTGWSQAMIDSFSSMKDYLGKLKDEGKIVNPDVNISPEIVAKFETQAKTELGPYFNQLFSQGKVDIEKATKRLAEDYGTKERELGLQFGQAQEATQESFARRGLSFSTMRTGAEQRLAEGARTDLEALQQKTFRAGEDTGQKAERELGSQFLPKSFASIQTGATPTLGKPGQYGFQAGGQSRELFTPTGGQVGTLEQQRIKDEELRKRELLAGERELRSSFYI